MTRPFPPADMIADMLPSFRPAPEVEQWARRTFISELSEIYNEDHTHLQQADLGFLWTNVANNKNGRAVAGQCELMPPMAMGKWQRERAIYQINEWFGGVPDFLITLNVHHAALRDDASFMALVEHELLHAGQDKDEFGLPKFSKQSGKPVFAIRGHDIEEFTSIVARYGAAAAGMEEAVRAANKGPTVAPAAIARSCGTCLRLVKA